MRSAARLDFGPRNIIPNRHYTVGIPNGRSKLLMFPAIAPETYSILLAEDLALVRGGLAALCEAQARYRVVAQCSGGFNALRLIESDKPDIAILDLNLQDLSIFEILRKLREAQTQTRVMLLFARHDRKAVLEALRLGATGFLLKSDTTIHLLEGFDQILDGGIYISPSFDIDKIFISGKKYVAENPLEALSAREYEVFSLLVAGNRAKEVAAQLDLSPKTVDSYRASLMRKLDINSLAGLVKFAIERGIA
jgi:DNA-binding NarL/FixJ family response regulator